MRLWIRVVSLCVLAALAGCVMRYKEEYLVRPMPAPAPSLEALKDGFPVFTFSEARIPVADGAELYSLRLLRPDAKATVLYFGGNGYRIGANARFSAAVYADLPVNLVLVDHRGYGASTGAPRMEALMDDALAVYDDLRADKALAGVPLIVHGQSMGSFMAGHVAAQRRLDGVVLESSATTTEAWVAYQRSLRPFWQRLLVRKVEVDGPLAGRGNLPVARGLDEPVLYVVGAEDRTTPPAFSREMYEATPLPVDRRQLLVVPERGHNDATRSDAFRQAMSAFVARIVARG